MANGIKYQAHEILNKVLNSAETGLQVDIVAGAEYAEDSAHTSADTGNFILGVRNDTLAALGGADGDYVPFQMNASGALFVEVASSSGDDSIYVDDADWSDGSSKHTLVGGLYQSSPQSITDGDTGPLQVNANGNLIVDLSATDNAVLDAIAASLALLDNSIASGNELQVDVVASLPAGSAAIGKLAANSGVDIGDVDVTSLPASTNTIEVVGDAAEDAAVAGNPLLAGGRYDATQRTLDDGDAGALALDPSGALYTREYTGQDGAVYTTASSDVIVPPTGKAWVAIQMLEDTTFDSSGGLIAVTATKWFNTEDAAGDLGSGSESTAEGSGGKQISNSITFPQGMTIFGRWSGIDVNSGSVIAYIGDY